MAGIDLNTRETARKAAREAVKAAWAELEPKLDGKISEIEGTIKKVIDSLDPALTRADRAIESSEAWLAELRGAKLYIAQQYVKVKEISFSSARFSFLTTIAGRSAELITSSGLSYFGYSRNTSQTIGGILGLLSSSMAMAYLSPGILTTISILKGFEVITREALRQAGVSDKKSSAVVSGVQAGYLFAANPFLTCVGFFSGSVGSFVGRAAVDAVSSLSARVYRGVFGHQHGD